MKFLIYFFIGISLISCKTEIFSKTSCYRSHFVEIKNKIDYDNLIFSFKKQIVVLKNDSGIKIYNPEYVKAVRIDSIIFFNSTYKKCLVLLLQKTTDDLNLDHVQIIQGDLINNKWLFKLNRLPSVPEITFTVNKVKHKNKPINNSFDELSKQGLNFVLNAGTVTFSGCDIDNKYWFGE